MLGRRSTAFIVAHVALVVVALLSSPTSASDNAARRRHRPLVTLRDEEDFAAFYSDAPLGLVVYTSTNCNACADVSDRVRDVVKRVTAAVPQTPTIPIARIVNDVTSPEVDQLYSRGPHYGPPVPSVGVVRSGKLIARRWRGGVDDPAQMESQLRKLLKPDVVELRSPSDVSRLMPGPTGWSGTGGWRHVQGRRERIVIVGLFPVPSPLEAQLRDVADYLRDAPNVTVAISHSAQVAEFFAQSTSSATIGAFHEMRAGKPPHWYHEAVRRQARACGDASFLADGGATREDDGKCDGDKPKVSVTTFLGWHARPWVADAVVSDDRFVPGAAGDFQVSLVTTPANLSAAVSGLGIDAREALGEAFVVALGWPPEQDSDKKALPWGVTVGAVRNASRQHGVVLAGVTSLGIHREYGPPHALEMRATVTSITRAVEDIRHKRLRHYTRSQPMPAIAPSPPTGVAALSGRSDRLVTLVGESFEETVARSGKHVLVLVTGNGCEHSADCVQLVAIFHDLADAFRNDDTLIVATINGDENDLTNHFQGRNSYPEVAFVNHYVGAIPEWYALELEYEDLWRFAAQRLLSWTGTEQAPPPKRSQPPTGGLAASKSRKQQKGRRRGLDSPMNFQRPQ